MQAWIVKYMDAYNGEFSVIPSFHRLQAQSDSG